jgi:predicted nucleic acid-binding protein
MILLDTNVISELMKPHPDGQVREWLLSRGEESLATTAITVAEIHFGLERLPDGKRRDDLYERFARLAGAMSVLPLDSAAGAQAGAFRARRERLGLPAAASDMMIAGIAATAGANLATRNIRDFEGLPIAVVDPWQAR